MSCINQNTVEFKKLQQETGLHPDILAAKIKVFQDNTGIDVFPTKEDLNTTEFQRIMKPLRGNEFLYDYYKLLTKDGKIKALPSKQVAEKYAESFNKKEDIPNKFKALLSSDGNWRVFIVEESSTQTGTGSFSKEKNDKLKDILSKLYPEVTLQYTEEDILAEDNTTARGAYWANNVLINSLQQSTDTLPHEYAHHYIKLFKNSDIVKEGIEQFGSEEQLVQAIGEQTVEGLDWYNKFYNWIKGLFSKKQKTLNKLVNDFLSEDKLNEIGEISSEIEYQKESNFNSQYSNRYSPSATKVPTKESIIEQLDKWSTDYKKVGDKIIENSTNSEVANRQYSILQTLSKKYTDKVDDTSKLKYLAIHNYMSTIIDFIVADKSLDYDEINNIVYTLSEKSGLYSNVNIQDFVTISNSHFNHLVDGARLLINEINKTQEVIDPTQKADIRTDQLIYSKDKELGGTIDLFATYSNGMVGTFDFVAYKAYKDEVTGKYNPISKKQRQEKSYKMGFIYGSVLEESLGNIKFRQNRLIPIKINYNKDGFANDTNGIEIATSTNPERYLQYIPIKSELTGIEKLDEFIAELYAYRSNIENDKKKDLGEKTDILRRIDADLQLLQVKQDIELFALQVQDVIRNIDSKLNDNTEDITFRWLSNQIEYLELYKDIHKTLKGTDLNSRIQQEKYQSIIDTTKGSIDRLIIDLTEIKNSKLAKEAGEDLTKNHKESSIFTTLFRGMAATDNPVFRYVNKLLRRAEGNKKRRIEDFNNQLEGKVDKLREYGYKNGKSLQEVFDLFLDKDKNLVSEYSSKWYDDLNNAYKTKDFAWFNKHLKLNEEVYLKYRTKLEDRWRDPINSPVNRLERLQDESDEEYATRKEEIIQKILSNYDHNINPEIGGSSVYQTAYKTKKLNMFFTKVPDQTTHINPEYKFIQSVPELKDFYDFHKESIKYARKVVGYDNINNDSFTPNYSQDMWQKIGQNGIGGISSMGNLLKDGFVVKENDNMRGLVDETGKAVLSIPVYGLSFLDPQIKSTDLAQNLSLFMSQIYSKNELENIEVQVHAARSVLENEVEMVVTDKFGNDIISKLTGKVAKKMGIPTSTLATFDKYIRRDIYGQYLQDNTVVEIGNTKVDFGKVYQAVSQILTIKSLALNPILATSNYIGAKTSAYLTGKEGLFFTNKSFNDSVKQLTNRNSKDVMIYNFLSPAARDLSYTKARSFSANKLTKLMSMENLMIGHRLGDDNIDKSIALAMSRHYVVDSDGFIKNPKLDKIIDKNAKSVYDSIVVNNDKVSIDGLKKINEDSEYDNFRAKIHQISNKIKGSTTREQAGTINTSIAGRAIMKFRDWMPGVIAGRYGTLSYDDILNSYDEGRVRATLGNIFGAGLKPAMNEMKSLVFEIASFGAYSAQVNEISLKNKYNKFMQKNPESKFTFDEFKDWYLPMLEGKMRATATELRVILGMITMLGLMGAADWDDDEDSNIIAYNTYKLSRRAALELTFFYDKGSVDEIIKSPIPALRIIDNIGSIVYNTVDEVTDPLLGENTIENTYKNIIGEKTKSVDKQNFAFYTLKNFPVINQSLDFFDYFEKN